MRMKNNNNANDLLFVKKWIEQGLTAENGKELVDKAKAFSSSMSISNTQFRNIFNELRRIEQIFNEPNDGKDRAIRALLLLQPKLAYLKKRDKNRFFYQKRYIMRKYLQN